jgi:hypothetical protein
MARSPATKVPVKKSTAKKPAPLKGGVVKKSRGMAAVKKVVRELSRHVNLPESLPEKLLGKDVDKLEPRGVGHAHFPTPESRLRICKYVAFGMPRESILALERLSDDTLHTHYSHEMKVGAEYITYLIANSLMQQALSGNTSAAQYYLSRRAKWAETINHKHEFLGAASSAAKGTLIGIQVEDDLNSDRKR